MAKIYGNLAQYHQTADVATRARAADRGRPVAADLELGVLDLQLRFPELLPPLCRRADQPTQPDRRDGDAFLELPGDAGRSLHLAKDGYTINPTNDQPLTVTLEPRDDRHQSRQPLRGYNWELLYHLPVAVAVHLSNNQRFAEAQKWFHLVFNPTNTDLTIPRRNASGRRSSSTAPGRRPASNRCSPCSIPPIRPRPPPSRR